MRTINKNNVSNKVKAKLLADRYADNLINNDQRRAAVTKHINKRISQIRTFAQTEQFFHGSLLSAYYHVEKHGDKTITSYYKETNQQIPSTPLTQAEIDNIYFKQITLMKHIVPITNFLTALRCARK
ncbi:hypothetical protein NECAME_08803 [Necator americanus]|uniref:Uncharacterized protein n=1 Tax=Necator americanus TaxID=51031 RepID=W2TIK9_NECAM|nr:hypothetical protein NECAME_08803 [Necator americanus]ETN81001.1 hypothetical protein NECAME_08803 [Necator americanus]